MGSRASLRFDPLPYSFADRAPYGASSSLVPSQQSFFRFFAILAIGFCLLAVAFAPAQPAAGGPSPFSQTRLGTAVSSSSDWLYSYFQSRFRYPYSYQAFDDILSRTATWGANTMSQVALHRGMALPAGR